jgi:hypothetical protein
VVTLLNGAAHSGGREVDTVDAFFRKNGRLVEATAAQVDLVVNHVEELKRRAAANQEKHAGTDLREAVRACVRACRVGNIDRLWKSSTPRVCVCVFVRACVDGHSVGDQPGEIVCSAEP